MKNVLVFGENKKNYWFEDKLKLKMVDEITKYIQ